MMDEKKSGPVEVMAGDTCSECWRPAVFGFRSMYGDVNYSCEGHVEIHKLYGELDWLIGERDYTVGDWLKQVRAVEEGAWDGAGDMKHFLLLKDQVSDDFEMPYKGQHECTLESLLSAVNVACKLTQEKIDRKELELQRFTKEMDDAAWDAGSEEAELGR